ncbi:MAG: DUF4417 domain-containing protein [Actinomycetota bacterium]|nr:DUF4417 domain-containing protein [Actinomycetota bacterium]
MPRSLTQEDVASKLGVSRQTVGKWESGRATPELEKLIALCDLLGCTLDELVGRTEAEIAFMEETASPAAVAPVAAHEVDDAYAPAFASPDDELPSRDGYQVCGTPRGWSLAHSGGRRAVLPSPRAVVGRQRRGAEDRSLCDCAGRWHWSHPRHRLEGLPLEKHADRGNQHDEREEVQDGGRLSHSDGRCRNLCACFACPKHADHDVHLPGSLGVGGMAHRFCGGHNDRFEEAARWKRFNGVILPDFSVYRDMPFVMQLWNIYRSRAIGFWLQTNGIKVIVNIRWGDKRTFRFCCDGVAKGYVIAVGTNGAIGNTDDRRYFTEGLAVVVKRIAPSIIVVYGSAPEDIFGKYRKAGIEIVQFDCETTSAHKGVE